MKERIFQIIKGCVVVVGFLLILLAAIFITSSGFFDEHGKWQSTARTENWGVTLISLIWWVVGLYFSLVIGQWLTRISLAWIRRKIKDRAKQENNICDKQFDDFYGKEYFSPTITGTIERLFFTILVGFNASGTATAMILWVSAKMAANWLIVIRDEKEQWKRQMAFSALLGSVISLFFALVGGLIFSQGVTKCP